MNDSQTEHVQKYKNHKNIAEITESLFTKECESGIIIVFKIK